MKSSLDDEVVAQFVCVGGGALRLGFLSRDFLGGAVGSYGLFGMAWSVVLHLFESISDAGIAVRQNVGT